MSRAPSLRCVRPSLSRLAWMLALPLLAGCAYDSGGYYDNGYGYPYGYGYGYPYGYGYGYYGAYGFFGGDDCWSWGCDDRRHHRDHDDNDNDDSHHHHGDSGVGMNVPRFHPPESHPPESNVPRHFEQPNGENFRPNFRAAPAAPPPVWIPPQFNPKH